LPQRHISEQIPGLNLAHCQIKFGDIPLENFAQLMETQDIDADTARLVSTGMGEPDSGAGD